MKTLHCSDIGFDCNATVEAASEEEVLTIAVQHAQTVQGVKVTPQMAEQIMTLIKGEEVVVIK